MRKPHEMMELADAANVIGDPGISGSVSWSPSAIVQVVQTIAILLGIPALAFRLGGGIEALKQSVTAQGVTVTELKEEQKKFGAILTQVAVQNTRLDNQGSQLTMLVKTVEDMRRGEGFILPLDRGAREIK